MVFKAAIVLLGAGLLFTLFAPRICTHVQPSPDARLAQQVTDERVEVAVTPALEPGGEPRLDRTATPASMHPSESEWEQRHRRAALKLQAGEARGWNDLTDDERQALEWLRKKCAHREHGRLPPLQNVVLAPDDAAPLAEWVRNYDLLSRAETILPLEGDPLIPELAASETEHLHRTYTELKAELATAEEASRDGVAHLFVPRPEEPWRRQNRERHARAEAKQNVARSWNDLTDAEQNALADFYAVDSWGPESFFAQRTYSQRQLHFLHQWREIATAFGQLADFEEQHGQMRQSGVRSTHLGAAENHVRSLRAKLEGQLRGAEAAFRAALTR